MRFKTYMYILIISTISILTNTGCNDKQRVQKILKKDLSFEFLDINNNIIQIKKNHKGKIFFTLDPECPLCKSYSKTINILYEKYNKEIDFYSIYTPLVFSKVNLL